MPDLGELLASVAEYIGDDKAKARSFAVELNTNDATKPVADVLLKRGISKRTADVSAQVTQLEAEVARLKEDVEEKDAEIAKGRSEAPDWAKKLEATEAKAAKKLADANALLEAERRARDEDTLTVYRQRFLKELGPGVNVDEEWAETVMSAKYAPNFRLTPDRKLEVLEPEDMTPYGADAGDPIKALATDALRAVPGKYRIMGRTSDAGGGVTGGATGEFKPRTTEQIQQAQQKAVGYARP